MLATLIADLAIPPWLRVLIAPALIAAGAIAAWLWFAGHYYDKGYDARSAEIATAAAEYERRIAGINAANAATGAKADATIATLRRRLGETRTTLQEALTDEPDFAAVRRPDRVHAIRVRDLDDLARAAADRELRD
jgi:hypothetical protein